MSDPRLVIGSAWGSANDALLDTLDSVRPIIRVAADAPPTARRGAAALFSMLVRVFPHTVVDGSGLLGANPWRADGLESLSTALVRARPAPTRNSARDLVIGVGELVEGAELWIGGGDWTVRVGSTPQPISPGPIGLGLQAAAAQAAGEVTKRVFGAAMMQVPIDGTSVWNLIDHTLAERETQVARLSTIPVCFLGAGSVGTSSGGVLVMNDEMCGTAFVVDPDSFDPTRNVVRYPVSTGAESGPKARWLSTLLAEAGWQVEDLVGSVGQWTRARSAPGFDGFALSSVDTLDGRLEVADVLARTNLTVGVAGLALHIQREHLGDGFACPFCQYVATEPAVTQLQIWATLTGISVPRVAELHFDHAPLSVEDVGLAVVAGRLHPETASELIGRRLDDLIHRAYAEATVSLPEGGATEVSAPYVSWMAGVLAAAELTKAAAGLPMIDRRFDLDMSGIPLGVVRRRRADDTGRCVCGPGIRSRWTAKLYGGTWNQMTQSA